MDYSHTTSNDEATIVHEIRAFDLEEILDCGQCFRWQRQAPGVFTGVAFGLRRTVEQRGDQLILHGVCAREFEEVWHGYFDLDRDYSTLKQRLCQDEAMARAVAFCPGMRVLRQEPWEALCSFIISQNNNIPRIKGIVERLCKEFGGQLQDGGHAFPTPERLAALEPEDLAEVRSGFRARYIIDAARLVASGDLALEPLRTMPLDEARAQLMRIKGVGVKVAQCALLYGLGRAACVPVDVWIARALQELYPQGFPPALEDVAGLAQQYLFHYMRKGPRADEREAMAAGV